MTLFYVPVILIVEAENADDAVTVAEDALSHLDYTQPEGYVEKKWFHNPDHSYGVVEYKPSAKLRASIEVFEE